MADDFENAGNGFKPGASGNGSDEINLDALLADLNLDFKNGDPVYESDSDEFLYSFGGRKPVLDPYVEPERPSRKSKRAFDRQDPPEPPSRSYRGISIFLLLLSLALVAGIAFLILRQRNADPYEGKIVQNVWVAGVDVGGMSRSEAVSAVEEAVGSRYTDQDMVVVFGKKEVALFASQMNLRLSAATAVDAAYAYGRTGSISDRQKAYRAAQLTPVNIDILPCIGLDRDYLRSVVGEYLNRIGSAYVPSGYTLTGERPALDADGYDPNVPCQELVLTVGSPGSSVNMDAVCETIEDAYNRNIFRVVIPSQYLNSFPKELDLEKISSEICVAPVEAVAGEDISKGVPGSCGYTFSLEDAKARLASAEYGDVITIPMEYVVPQQLDANGSFTETIGTYATCLSTDNAYNKNMLLLCQSLDGFVLQPGETFSFAANMQSRTAQNGYQMAPSHPGYCLNEELGGGADQVASTLYVAALYANMKIVQKNMADHVCSYTMKGTELTVGQNWQDLKFSNPLSSPVLIRAKISGNQVIIRFLTDVPLDYYVKLEFEETSTLPAGTFMVGRRAADGFTEKQVLIEGIDGAMMKFYRILYSKDTNAELSRETEYIQVNAAHKAIVSLYA